MKTQTRNILGVLIISLFVTASAMAQPPHAKAKGNKHKKVQGGPPPWAPAHGYRAKMQQTRHIYYPEHDVYYDTRKEVYIYADMGRWEVSVRLPLPLRNQNIERSTHVALDVQSEWPQVYHDEHVERYRSESGSRNIRYQSRRSTSRL